MEALEKLIDKSIQPHAVSGRWYIVQWTPDRALAERLNIGLAFVDNSSNRASVKMLDYYDRLTCLYDESAEFQLRLACDIANEVLINASEMPVSIGRQLHVEPQGIAQGESIDLILENLYESSVPLGRLKSSPVRSERFKWMSREVVCKSVNATITSLLGLRASELIASDPYTRLEDAGDKKFFVPYRMNDGIATLASAVYASADKISNGIHEANFDLRAAMKGKDYRKCGLFVLRATEGVKPSIQDVVDTELDKVIWLANKDKIYVEVSESTETLGEHVAEWSGIEAA